MNDSDSTRVHADEIFFAAMEIDSEVERAAYIETACGDDLSVRHQVQRLLSALDASESFFAEDAPTHVTTSEVAETLDGIDGILSRADAEAVDEEIGKQIGPYRLIRKIGEGGSSNVYVAEQSAPVRRLVAFKMIRRGMDSKSVIARFESERQALALMDHPNIAHVYDAGDTDSGRPFFVMELVDGIPITRYCRENDLGIRPRLELFIQVCSAIQHAHQKGIIHRDIKPSNVLVDFQSRAPRPRVIDFGIAKAMHKGVLGGAEGNTVMQPFIGTPTYMSPEQARMGGVDLDTRSDIYSLGTLLYELMTGCTPFDLKQLLEGGLDEMRRILMEQEPVRPSVRLQTEKFGDLDWIVMKALEKDRERRYETVDALAQDIHRYLNHEPIEARPPSRGYRFQKMVRRNRGLVVSVCAVLATLMAGLSAVSWLLVREHSVRQSESRLRMEAEARENIAMAAVLLQRNRYVEAEQLVDACELPVIKPSLEAGRVFQNLANWRLMQGEWQKASKHMLRFARAVQVDKSDLTDEATRGLICVAPTLVVAGDLENYNRYIHETLAHFSTTENPIAAEHVIKMCVILPCDDAMLDELQRLADMLKKSVILQPTESDWDNLINAWRVWAIAACEYRAGHFAEAAKWARGNLSSPDRSPARMALDHVVLAMALHHMGISDDASSEFSIGREMIRAGLPDGLDRIASIGNNRDGVWFDWVIAKLWLTEGESVLKGTP
ncbi:MAG: serine/threonine protein kinase [Pontiellaceae bacterium]|nr:serine/threonine protein kinase [Pontiellaceae bacterium]MBN2784805.1 serine/threonine protein kinase [Pontiellaceae bacterium]